MDVDLSSTSSAFAPNILFSLRADRTLLDPTFDRYILRSEPLAMTKRKMDDEIRYKLPSDSQWGYQQIRAHTLAPHLFFDHFASSADRQIFFAFHNDLRLISLSFDQSAKCWGDPVQVANIATSSPLASFVFGSEEDALALSFPESLHFVDSQTAITSHGLNAFSVWHTGDRRLTPPQMWREVFNYELPPLHNWHENGQMGRTASGTTVADDSSARVGFDTVYPTLILDARRTPPGAERGGANGVGICSIDVLLLTVEPTTADQRCQKMGEKAEGEAEAKAQQPGNGKSVFRTHLIWVTVQHQPQQANNSSKFAVQRTRQIRCDGKVEFASFDASVPPRRRLVVFGVGRSPQFVWDSAKSLISDAGQTEVDVEEAENKGDRDETMEVVYQQEKAKEGGVLNDTTISSSLDAVLQPSAAGDAQQQFNAEQLEECDRLPDVEDDVSAFWLDGDSHELVAMTIVNKLLFTQKILPEGAPVFATRYDVDAIVWQHDAAPIGGPKQTNNGTVSVSHLFTLNAFGYIQAGHQDKRFLGCSPDGRYATLINRSNHCFLYFQNSAVPDEHELTNRRTGKRAEHIAKQLVLSMADLDKAAFDPNDSANQFIGFHAMSDTLFLLTCNAIYAVEMPK